MKGLNYQFALDIQIRKIEIVAANFFNRAIWINRKNLKNVVFLTY